MYNPPLTRVMTSAYNPAIHRFAVFTVCWTILLFVAGALVTSKDAALSVPDWPKSYGTWFPSMRMLAGGAFFEHSHRVIAAVMGFLVLLLAIWLWRKDPRPWMRWFGLTAIAGVVAQAVLGGQVVRRLLHYWLPVIHACFAQIVFGAVLGFAVFTSKWWVSERPQLEDSGSPSIHSVAILNAAVIYIQVILGAGFRHKEIPIWPHMAGALLVLGMVIWTAVALRKRFGQSRELSKARVMLHAIFGTQFLLGFGAYWSRLTTVDAPQPMPVMVYLTVIHTVVGAILFAFSILVVLMCYRLIPRGRGARDEHGADHGTHTFGARQRVCRADEAGCFIPCAHDDGSGLLHGRARTGRLAAYGSRGFWHDADRCGDGGPQSLHRARIGPLYAPHSLTAAAKRRAATARSADLRRRALNRRRRGSLFGSWAPCRGARDCHLPELLAGVHSTEEAHGVGNVRGRISRSDSAGDWLGGGHRLS